MGKKVIVIGLDGTPYSLINKLVRRGVCPNLASLLSDGSLHSMNSILPTVSSVAWTSFMTGKNPGQHGIFGFMERRPDSYKIYFPNSHDIKSETIWAILGKSGKRSIVLNVPSTYPAMELNGVLISGFVAIDLDRSVFPPSLLPRLREINYKIDVDSQLFRESKDKFIDDLWQTLESREIMMISLLESEKWDLFIGAITETDRLHHFFWEDMEDETGYSDTFYKVYTRIDEIIGKVVDHMDRDTSLIIMSDHGFCRLKKEVYLNYWLKENGLLKFATHSPRSIADISSDSKAYCLDPGRIYINLRDREPMGCVDNGREYEEVREWIIEGLSLLEDGNSGKIFKRIYRREELYNGPYFNNAPDIVVDPMHGYDVKGAVAKDSLTGDGIFTGMHTYDDALFYISGNKIKTDIINIIDIAPNILALMGEKIPIDMDGAVFII